MASTDTTADQTTVGLSSAEAEQWLAKYGRNEVAEDQESVLKKIAKHFWAPVPWMLEAMVVFQFVVGEYIEATLIAAATPVQRRARDVSGRPGQRGAVLRERGHMWYSRPSLVLMLLSLADIVIVCGDRDLQPSEPGAAREPSAHPASGNLRLCHSSAVFRHLPVD